MHLLQEKFLLKEMNINQVNCVFFYFGFQRKFFYNSVHEALRQINIQMIDSTNLYDGLETLWLGSADESLSSQQVYFICAYKLR